IPPGPGRSAAPSMAAEPVAGMQNTEPSTAGCGLPSVRSPAGLPFSLMHSARGPDVAGPPKPKAPGKPNGRPAAARPGQKLPSAAVFEAPEVLSGFRFTANGARRVAGGGGQSCVVSWAPTGVHARPARGAALQVPEMHFGHGEVALPVRWVRENSGMLTVDAPVVRSPVPLASFSITLITQVLRPPFAIGSGGPKRQFSASAQEPGIETSQSVATGQAAPLVVGPMPCLPGPAPLGQSHFPGPLLASRSVWWAARSKTFEAPSTTAPGGTLTAFPPPRSRQARPRSESFVVQAVSEKIAPPKGANGPGLRPAPPQLLVPGMFVVTRWAKLGVVVVVLAVVVVVVGAVVVVGVVGTVVGVAGSVVVVVVVVGVGAAVVVVGAAVVVLAQGFGEHVPGPWFVPPALEHCVAVSTMQVKAPIGEPGTQH